MNKDGWWRVLCGTSFCVCHTGAVKLIMQGDYVSSTVLLVLAFMAISEFVHTLIRKDK